jgi:hypothetical protein
VQGTVSEGGEGNVSKYQVVLTFDFERYPEAETHAFRLRDQLCKQGAVLLEERRTVKTYQLNDRRVSIALRERKVKP